MKKAEGHPASLRDGDRIVVIGGGPAGSFFAIKFLRECRRLERRIEVVIVEKRRAKDPGGEGYRLDSLRKASEWAITHLAHEEIGKGW